MTQKAVHGAKQAVPGWGAFADACFSCDVVTGGLTNKLNLVRVDSTKNMTGEEDEDGVKPTTEHQKALVRTFGVGTDSFINREYEWLVSEAMSNTGIAPRIIGSFPGGRAEEFIDNASSVLNADLHRPNVMKEVARMLGIMHSIDLELPENKALRIDPVTPTMLHQLWSEAARTRSPKDTRKALKLAALQVANLGHEVDWVVGQLENAGAGKVLCHRDLQSGNVMIRKEQGHPDRVYLIDFEYSGRDYCAFDYGNVFCEMSINNFCPKFPGFVLDSGMYPSRSTQREFFRTYLANNSNHAALFQFFRTYLANNSNHAALFPGVHHEMNDDSKIDKLCRFADLGALASHLQWALWGIVQSTQSNIDFGHLEYAAARLDQYY
eukprot:CAMPEP_0184535746 /NCGR_PEP_ID=MMETSP0198_2-20121128/16057_1 /TAXON_ID=1112570 /ORGANISM="Thraustochytrium sp., Strain LLF1b" /LENGTH=379 /DNA_ID=CAMNT_0026928815 /DNA_START=223 /DNA_END=1359 /DNA_ORIENTATION=+